MATEKSAETFKQGVEKFTEQANVVARMPEINLTEPVARYFEYVQKSVDFNRDLATRWAEIVTSLYGTVREQADKVTGKKESERQAKAAERAEARRAKRESREPYEGLTKAELSDLLAERELPKSGTVDELIDRLVSADSE